MMTNDYDWLTELNKWIREIDRWFDRHRRLFRRPRMIQTNCKPREGYRTTRRKARPRTNNTNSRNAREGVTGR